ncbi:MAG TPA: secretin N-terminal domain-containing protein [Acidobacteriota bacterium]|nr:secretin N-terminal domain-containing protein [Acidobacteriota bacterium]
MFRRQMRRLQFLLGITLPVLVFLVSVTAQEGKDPEALIESLQFQAADIHSVLTFLADYGGVNVVVSPKVEGTVTIKLSNVHWRTAMDIIGRTYDLAVVDEGDGYIRVLPSEDFRKEVTESNKHSQEQRQLVELETKIVKISNSTAEDIVKTVNSLMTERGQATADVRSNSIILQEVPDNMATVLEYIGELDKPSRQIKISAQLLEISSQGLEEIGVSWTSEGTYTTNSDRSYTQTGQVDAEAKSAVGRYTLGSIRPGDWTLNGFIEAIVSEGKGKIIAHPEITTLDNTEARIQMGQKVPVKQFDESGNVVIKFEEVGTILVVTPHITAENQVLMHLQPERSTYQFDPNGVIINTNNAETRIIVENGQTAVIGGLTTQDEVESVDGVPILKDIPVLGALFRHSQKRTESRDLVIFVTPSIVEDDLAMKN